MYCILHSVSCVNILHIMLHEAHHEICYIKFSSLGFMLVNMCKPAELICAVVSTGVGLGGGLGIGANLWGASVDSVLGIGVISTWQNNTADWDIVRINSTNYPDLFWGMLVRSTWRCSILRK